MIMELTTIHFDEERLDWCDELNFDFYKIARDSCRRYRAM